MDPLSSELLSQQTGSTRIEYGLATGVNTVDLTATGTSISLPALRRVVSGQYCAVLVTPGGDRLILGPVDDEDGDDDWSPTFDNLVKGIGHSEQGSWRYGNGQLSCWYWIIFGTGGSPGTTPNVYVPSGFSLISNTFRQPLGIARFVDASVPVIHTGQVSFNSSTRCRIRYDRVTGNYVQGFNITASEPFTWTIDDALAFHFTAPVERT